MANGEQTLAVGLAHKTGAKAEYKADAEQYTLVRKKMRAWSLRMPSEKEVGTAFSASK